jgi:hypothetical protein
MRWLLLFSLFISRLAFADKIPPMPPMDCATGARATSSHSGTYCSPTGCQSSEDCEEGQVCQQQGLCINFSTYNTRNGKPAVRSKAGDNCSAKKACTSGECEVVKRCVPKGTKATPGPENKLTRPTPEEINGTKTPEPETDPEPEPDPKTPEPEPQPDSQPESAPESTPTKAQPPTKVDKGRCSVSPADTLSASWVGLFLAFSLILARRRANTTK